MCKCLAATMSSGVGGLYPGKNSWKDSERCLGFDAVIAHWVRMM